MLGDQISIINYKAFYAEEENIKDEKKNTDGAIGEEYFFFLKMKTTLKPMLYKAVEPRKLVVNELKRVVNTSEETTCLVTNIKYLNFHKGDYLH